MKKIIGIMGPNNPESNNLKDAYELGKYFAENDYCVLTGGLNVGIQNEGLKGAKAANGLTIGIMPFNEPDKFSKYIDIPIITNMRSGRNYINTLSSNIIFVCGIDAGTVSEIALSLVKSNDKNVILVGAIKEANDLFQKLRNDKVYVVKDYREAIDKFNSLNM